MYDYVHIKLVITSFPVSFLFSSYYCYTNGDVGNHCDGEGDDDVCMDDYDVNDAYHREGVDILAVEDYD